MIQKYPDRIPIIIECGSDWNHGLLDKHKYLVPADLSFFNLQYILRKRIRLRERETMFLFCGKNFIKPDSFVADVY
jgi:hypothetical protein